MTNYWQKQGAEPLFPDLQWSRPENRAIAGKLLIVGGNTHGFAAPAKAYTAAQQAGIGTIRIGLPNALRQVAKTFGEGELLPSTPSGSFSKQALGELLDHAEWSDAVILAGDFGRNSETAVMLENFVYKYRGPLVLAEDSIDNFYARSESLLERPSTLISGSLTQLQRLLVRAGSMVAVYSGMNVMQLAEALHHASQKFPAYFVTYHQDQLYAAAKGRVSTTFSADQNVDLTSTAAVVGVWWLQNPSKPFEAISTGIFQISKDK